jgi:hypothetical protein
LTINHLPDEILLEIFDSYRKRVIDSTNHQRRENPWREKYLWFNLTHVCRKWRAVTSASPSRLDLGITVGPYKPGDINTVLSSTLPIFLTYRHESEAITRDIPGLLRMRDVLEHHRDRMREIAFQGTTDNFDQFFKETKCDFPVLESLSLYFGRTCSRLIPDTFLGGPDLSHLHLRRLALSGPLFTSKSRLLSSATTITSLTDLLLTIFTETHVSPSSLTFLLACLQRMHGLRSLDLSIIFGPSNSWSQPPTPKDIVPLSKLKHLRYNGHSALLNALMAGLSAPSLRDVFFQFHDEILPPAAQLHRFIDEIEEQYHVAEVIFSRWEFYLFLLTQSEYICHRKPHFELHVDLRYYSKSIMQMSGALSTRLTTVEVLKVTFDKMAMADTDRVKDIMWRRFYQQFPSVKVLRTEGASNTDYIARTLHQVDGRPDGLGFFPALEEINLGKNSSTDKRERESQLVAFEPFVSARQQASRPVKVFFGP